MNLNALFFVITIIKITSAEFNNEVEIINDLLSTEKAQNIGVSAYLCSNTENKMILLNKLLEFNYAVSIFNVDEHNLQYIYPRYKQVYILDIDCSYFEDILLKANTLKLFAPYYTWILLSKSVTILDKIPNITLNLNMFQDSDIILVRKVQKQQYLIHEIYKETPISYPHVNIVNLWSKQDKLLHSKPRNIPEERKNLNRITLGAGIVILEADSVNHLDDYKYKHIDSITKVNYVLVKHLIEYFNASLKIYPVDSWGYFNKTSKQYTGMIGSLQKNESEIGGTALFMTVDRIPTIDYISMTTPTKVRFVFRQPPLSYEQNIFTLPFTRELWICSFCLVLLSIFLLYSTVHWEWTVQNFPEGHNSLRNSFLDCVMLTFAAVAQQGASTEPRSGPGKLIMIMVFITLMFLYVSYSANIVALLQSSATNIRTLEDLLESRLKLGADDTVYNRYYMSTATERIRKAIYEKKIAPMGQTPHFITLEEGVKKIREGFYAFHMELGRGYKLVADTFFENEKCGIQEINFLDVVDAYLAIKKNSTYKEMFTIGLRKLRENGIQNRELSKIYTDKPECHIAGGSFVSVGLIDSYPAFLFLGAGVGLSLLLFTLEIAFSKTNRLNKLCLEINK